jgi:hypothetical protein
MHSRTIRNVTNDDSSLTMTQQNADFQPQTSPISSFNETDQSEKVIENTHQELINQTTNLTIQPSANVPQQAMYGPPQFTGQYMAQQETQYYPPYQNMGRSVYPPPVYVMPDGQYVIFDQFSGGFVPIPPPFNQVK